MKHYTICKVGVGVLLYLFSLASMYGQSKYIPIDHSKGPVDTLTFTKKHTVSKQSMVSRFNTLFKTFHGEQERLVFKDTRNLEGFIYDSINHIFYGQLFNRNVLLPDAQVFAWHPYWMQEEYKYYPYGLMSTLCFFAYDLDPYTGSYNDPDVLNIWRTTPMLDSAHTHGLKVLLTVTSYGEPRNEAFLGDKAVQAVLGDSLRSLLRARKAQGVDLDFVDIPVKKSEQFVEFVKALRSKLGDTSIITLHIPATIGLKANAFNLKALSTLVNTFVVQGYEHEKEPRRRGAIAPLYTSQKGHCSMADAVEYCLHHGLKSSQMVAGLPLYGTLWEGKVARDLAYEDIVALYEKNHKPVLQAWTESAYIKLSDKDTLWYENAASLQLKFLWAKQHGLGIGLWGLGYDGGRKEIWEAVASQYAVPPVALMHPVNIDRGISYSLMTKLQQHRKPIGLGFVILLAFFVLGILLSLLDWRVREMFFRNYLSAALLTALLVIAMVAFLYCFSGTGFALERIILPFFIGALGGGALLYAVMKWYVSYRKKMP